MLAPTDTTLLRHLPDSHAIPSAQEREAHRLLKKRRLALWSRLWTRHTTRDITLQPAE